MNITKETLIKELLEAVTISTTSADTKALQKAMNKVNKGLYDLVSLSLVDDIYNKISIADANLDFFITSVYQNNKTEIDEVLKEINN